MSNDAHSAPSGGPGQELLYDADVATPTHAERARTLVAAERTGALATLARDPAGFPYGSFTTFGLEDGSPIFLISELAEHTRNLRGDPRCSLLVVEPGEGDPLARGRVTLIGEAAPLEPGDRHGRAKAAFLEAHPNAAYYIDYGDFRLWRLEVASLRYIGGYGRMSWVSREDWSSATADPLASSARHILDHMNSDHAEAMVLYCHAFTRATDTTEARMTAVDRYGFELSATTAQGPRPIRLAFSRPVVSAEEVRVELVALVKRARQALAGG